MASKESLNEILEYVKRERNELKKSEEREKKITEKFNKSMKRLTFLL